MNGAGKHQYTNSGQNHGIISRE